jgi:short-subunit dehydrogenase
MNVFITGASSGIGEYLAYEYSKQNAHIGITARRIDKLERIAKKCTELGGTISFYQLDVNDQEECNKIINQFSDKVEGIDIIIANAGVGDHDNLKTGDATTINNILHTNIIGLTNTIIPAIPNMINQKSGNIVIISSIASFFNIKYHGGYCASKIAVKTLANSWRKSLKKHNIKISTIIPGFIKSEMTQEMKYKMPFLMDTQTASKKIVKAIKYNKPNYIFPWQWRIVVPILRVVDNFL